jgi:hypothetical protein
MKKFNKIKTSHIIIGVIVALILLGVAYEFYNKEIVEKGKRLSDIILYKKAFYEAVLCEYSCPLKMQNVNNKSQLIPDVSCVKLCTEEFKKAKYENYSKEELYTDNLITDMASSIQNCSQESLNNVTKVRNNSMFFSCSVNGLDSLKEKYPYI